MIHPTADDVLASVIAAVESEIAPAVTDEYAASLCRTVAQLLRSVRVRTALEGEALLAETAELRTLLQDARGSLFDMRLRALVDDALRERPAPRLPPLAELQADAVRLRGALVAVIEASPDAAAPVRRAVRAHLRRQLARENAWQQDAYTGPRR